MFSLDLEFVSYNQLPGSLSLDYKYMHARQIPHKLSFPTKTISDFIRYITGVFYYNFKSQRHILASYDEHISLWQSLDIAHAQEFTLFIYCEENSGVVMFTYSIYEC